jgi:hypothetical protein
MANGDDSAAIRKRWHELAGSGLPLEAESVFRETDGYLVRRANEARVKLLQSLAPLLAKALEPAETIRYAACGTRYSAAELFLSGHLAARSANRTALVLTDRRLLLLQVDAGGRPKDLKNQLRLERVRRASASWLGSLTLQTVSREKLVFNSVPRADRNALISLLPGFPTAPRVGGTSVEHLCPACLRVVPGPVGSAERCPEPACRIPFRSPRRAAWLSALVPGVGDIYLRHFLFGSLEFVGSIAVLCFALFAIVAAAATRDSEVLLVAAVLGVLFILLPRLFDFFLTLHMGRKGIVPLSLTPAPAGVADGAPIGPSRGPALPAFPAWSWVLFAAGAVAVGATAWLSLAEARATARVLEACRLAETGRIAEATKLYEASAAAKPVAPSDRGRFALALWEGGDLDGGDLLVNDLGPIDREVAGRLDAFLARYEAAHTDLEDGRVALLDGKTGSAWEQIDRAVAFFATLENAPLPKSRYDAVVELAGGFLGPPLVPDDLAAATRMTDLAATLPGSDARLDVARSRIRAASGESASGPDTSRLDARWRLLALEARAALRVDPSDVVTLAREAEAVSLDDIRRLLEPDRADLRARRGALMLLGGRGAAVPDSDLPAARERAESQGWTGAKVPTGAPVS